MILICQGVSVRNIIRSIRMLMRNQMMPVMMPSCTKFFSSFLKYRRENTTTTNTTTTGMIDSNNTRFSFRTGRISNDMRNGINQMKNPNPTSLIYLFIPSTLLDVTSFVSS
jgi:hypothetical protein